MNPDSFELSLNEEERYYYEKYKKYKNKYTELKEQQGGLIYPNVYFIFFDKSKVVIKTKENEVVIKPKENEVVIKPDEVEINNKSYKKNKFESFSTFNKIFGNISYSLQYNTNYVYQIEAQGIFTKYYNQILKNISSLLKIVNGMGFKIDEKNLNKLINKTRISLDKSYTFDPIKRDYVRNIRDITKLPNNENSIIKKIINDIRRESKQNIDSFAIIDVGVRTNLFIKHYNIDGLLPIEQDKDPVVVDTSGITKEMRNKYDSDYEKTKNKVELEQEKTKEDPIVGGGINSQSGGDIITIILILYALYLIRWYYLNLETTTTTKTKQ
jgi:hypothetical protein